MEGHINHTMIITGQGHFDLKDFESPRGLRVGNKRPDRISISVNTEMTVVEFERYLKYLIELRHSMEL